MKAFVAHDQSGEICAIAVPSGGRAHPGAIRTRLEASGEMTFVELDIPDVEHDRPQEHLHELRIMFSVRNGRLIRKG